MNKSELLDAFSEIATCVSNEGLHQYWDASEPENLRSALDFYYSHLYWLDSRDKQELLEVWQVVCDDPRDVKLLFNSIRVLKEKYAGTGDVQFADID